MIYKKSIRFIFWYATISNLCFAVSAAPDTLTLIQPDGSEFLGFCRGDEWQAWHETLDGWSIIKNEERPLLIFPQGTRIKPNEVVPFKKGVGRIYEALNITCIPVALNSGSVWPKDGITKYPGKITVSFLKPIKPGLNRDEFIRNLEIKIYDEIKNIS